MHTFAGVWCRYGDDDDDVTCIARAMFVRVNTTFVFCFLDNVEWTDELTNRAASFKLQCNFTLK